MQGAKEWGMDRSAVFFEHYYGLCMQDSRHKKGRAICKTLPVGEKWRCRPERCSAKKDEIDLMSFDIKITGSKLRLIDQNGEPDCTA